MREVLGDGGFEGGKAGFQFVLGGGFLVGDEEGFTGGSELGGGGDGGGAGGVAVGEVVGRGVEAFALEEGVLEGGAGGALEVEVGEVLFLDAAGVLVGEVDAGDTFVVGRERPGNVRGHVGREGMGFLFDSENAGVGGEVDLDHDVLVGHLFKEGVWVVFVEDVNAVADALGVAEVDGFAYVEAEAFEWDEAGSELSGVERDADGGVDAVEVVEHLHLQVVVLHADAAVFGHDEVDADYVGVRRSHLETEEGLGEDLLGWEAAEYLVEEVDGDATGGGLVVWGVAVLEDTARGFRVG